MPVLNALALGHPTMRHHRKTSKNCPAHCSAPDCKGIQRAVPVTMGAAVLGLLAYGFIAVYDAQGTDKSPDTMTEEAVMARIQKVGQIALDSVPQGVGPRTGEEVFKAQCTTCHTAGLLGAPKFADSTAWAARLPLGYEALLHSALKGKNNMTPQGGGAFSDLEVGRALVYMANAAGGHLADPAVADPAVHATSAAPAEPPVQANGSAASSPK